MCMERGARVVRWVLGTILIVGINFWVSLLLVMGPMIMRPPDGNEDLWSAFVNTGIALVCAGYLLAAVIIIATLALAVHCGNRMKLMTALLCIAALYPCLIFVGAVIGVVILT